MERTLFEKDGKSFEKHVRVEHNVWNYLYFIVYLKDKNILQYNGTETYISEKLENDDLSWFPIQRAMCLSYASQEEEENVKAIVDEKLVKAEKAILDTINSINNDQSSQGTANLGGSLLNRKTKRAANRFATYAAK